MTPVRLPNRALIHRPRDLGRTLVEVAPIETPMLAIAAHAVTETERPAVRDFAGRLARLLETHDLATPPLPLVLSQICSAIDRHHGDRVARVELDLDHRAIGTVTLSLAQPDGDLRAPADIFSHFDLGAIADGREIHGRRSKEGITISTVLPVWHGFVTAQADFGARPSQ